VAFLVKIYAAATVDEVIAAGNDYLNVWREVLQRIPEGCRPSKIADAESVFRAASALEEHRRRLVDSNLSVGHELNMATDFFTAAANKIRRLAETRARVDRPEA
jgi:hypothetical protein